MNIHAITERPIISSTRRSPLTAGRGLGLLAAMALAGAGCTAEFAGGGAPGSDFGATQGGVQDMRFARDLVASGQVPPPEAFVVEGMFSEHDLGLSGAACETLLCLRSAVSVAPTLDGEPSGWLQIGMSSTIDPAAFERPSLTLVATVDVSGSMGWSYSDEEAEYPTPATLARRLLRSLSQQLGPRDRIAVVTYGGTVATPLPLTSGDRQDAIQAAVDGLGPGGSTNMEAGLRRAYEIARGAVAAGETAQTRVVLFTDVRPNVGITGASEFEKMVTEGAADGVGITVLGLGLGLGQEVMNAMSHVRGGNAFSMTRSDDAERFLADDWPWFASPIAYDLTMSVEVPAGFSIRERYGFPEGTEERIDLEVSTVFLSKRKGALLLGIAPEQGSDAVEAFTAHAGLRYTTPEGEDVALALEAAYEGESLDSRDQYHAQPATARVVALALLVTGMREAADLYGESGGAAAVELMQIVRDRFAADIEGLEDGALAAELDFADALLALMEEGAPQGSLYPY